MSQTVEHRRSPWNYFACDALWQVEATEYLVVPPAVSHALVVQAEPKGDARILLDRLPLTYQLVRVIPAEETPIGFPPYMGLGLLTGRELKLAIAVDLPYRRQEVHGLRCPDRAQ